MVCNFVNGLYFGNSILKLAFWVAFTESFMITWAIYTLWIVIAYFFMKTVVIWALCTDSRKKTSCFSVTEDLTLLALDLECMLPPECYCNPSVFGKNGVSNVRMINGILTHLSWSAFFLLSPHLLVVWCSGLLWLWPFWTWNCECC